MHTQKMMAKDGHPPMLEGNLSAGKVSQQLRALVTLAERPIVQVLAYLSSSSQTIPFPGTRDIVLWYSPWAPTHTCMDTHTATHTHT